MTRFELDFRPVFLKISRDTSSAGRHSRFVFGHVIWNLVLIYKGLGRNKLPFVRLQTNDKHRWLFYQPGQAFLSILLSARFVLAPARAIRFIQSHKNVSTLCPGRPGSHASFSSCKVRFCDGAIHY